MTPDSWHGAGLLAAWDHATRVLHPQIDEVSALNLLPMAE